jgi:hypothetical protein
MVGEGGRVRRIVLVGVVGCLGLLASGGSVEGKENPANDCLIGLKDASDQIIPDRSTTECTDGDACDADGATDGTCVFRIMGCVNIPGVEGCALRPVKKARFVTPNSNDEIVITPVSGEPSSVCSAFLDFHVPLKKKGKKAGKRKINASFKSTQKPPGQNKDSDKFTFVCNVCPTESCVPPTTTSTTTAIPTTTSTSTEAPTTTTTETTTTTAESTTTLEVTTTTAESTTTMEVTTTTEEESTTTMEVTTTTEEESTTTMEVTTTTEEESTTTMEVTTTTEEESTTTLEVTTTTEESTTTTTEPPSSPSPAFLRP